MTYQEGYDYAGQFGLGEEYKLFYKKYDKNEPETKRVDNAIFDLIRFII